MGTRRFERACAAQTATYKALRDFGLPELVQGVDTPQRVNELVRVFNGALVEFKADSVNPRVVSTACELMWTDDESRECRYTITVNCGRDTVVVEFTAYRDYDGNLGASVRVCL